VNAPGDPTLPDRASAAGAAADARHCEIITDPQRAVSLVQGGTRSERRLHTLWRIVGQRLMRLTFHNWYGIRRGLLRLFGANIHPTARIRPSVRISHPWRLSVGAHTAVGDHAILFCLGPITIGSRCTISQYAHLCAGSHDYTAREMTLVAHPITIEDDVWIAADVFVGPGVTVGRDSVVGARSTVFHTLPEHSICAGDNARPIGRREIRWPPALATQRLPCE
jgi:putative colanic acid biosynthesis acetyltransferase WcaF